MKKITLPLLLFTCFLLGCSEEEDDSTIQDGPYFEANYLGETFIDEGFSVGAISFGADGCNTSKDMTSTSLGQFEKSNLFLDAHLIHLEENGDFQSTNQTSSNLITDSYISQDCFHNLDLVINFTLNGNSMKLDESQENSSIIKKITKTEETNLEIGYLLEGEYVGNFISSEGDSGTLKGSYRVPINVLK